MTATARSPRRGAFRPDPDVAAAFASAYDPRHPIEEQLRQLWRELVRAAGGRSFHTHDSRRSDEGWPDESSLLPVRGGLRGGPNPTWRLLFVELKAPGKKPSAAQRECLEMLDACGEEVYLVTSSGDRGRDQLELAELLNPPRGKPGKRR